MASGYCCLTCWYCSRTGLGFSGVLVERLALQLPGCGLLDPNQADRSHLGAQRRGADHDAILAGAAAEFAVGRPLDQHLDGLAEPAPIGALGDAALGLEQDVDPTLLLRLRYVSGVARGGRARPGREALDMHDIELDLLEQLEGAPELVFGLTGIAEDHVGRDR